MKQDTLKSVMTKLSFQKVELAVDLGGIRKMSSQLKTDIKAYNQKFSTIDDLVRELNNEAKVLDKRAESFYAEIKELEREGRAKAKELGSVLGIVVDFRDTSIGKELDSIATSILSGELETIKQGLRIKF